jgi:hypothetical protein
MRIEQDTIIINALMEARADAVSGLVDFER